MQPTLSNQLVYNIMSFIITRVLNNSEQYNNISIWKHTTANLQIHMFLQV